LVVCHESRRITRNLRKLHSFFIIPLRKSAILQDSEIYSFFVPKRQVLANLTDPPADYTYWKEKGWINPEAKYYVDVPVNPVHNAICWISKQMLRRIMRTELVEV